MPTVPNWKLFELKVAKLFNSYRAPFSGGNSRHTRSDSLHPDLFISCKYSQSSAVHTLYDEENTKAQAEDKLPILCLQKARSKKFLVVVSNLDLIEFCIKFLKSKGYSVRRKKH